MSITPSPLGQAKGIRFEHGSVLGGKTCAAWVSSQWKSTVAEISFAGSVNDRPDACEKIVDVPLDPLICR
jgi:hypothetical protein